MLPQLVPRDQAKSASLSNRLLRHEREMLDFLFYSEYDIIYLTFEQRHAAYLQKKGNRDIAALRLDEMRRHYLSISERLHIRVLRFDLEVDKELYRLEALWDALQLPYFHRYYFLAALFTAYYKSIAALLATEQKLLRGQGHIYYAISRALSAREACLRNLKIKLAELTPQDVYEYLHVAKQKLNYFEKKFEKERYEVQGYKVKHLGDDEKQPAVWKTKLEVFFECFGHLKKLSYYLIDLILQWRQYIQSLTHDQRQQRQHFSYYYMEENYLLKMLTDLGFLRVSVLANFFDFAKRNDPFLLKCILAFEGKPNKTLDDDLLKQLIFPDDQEYDEVMAKLDVLAKEYYHNIQRRRVYDFAKNRRTDSLADRYGPNQSPEKLAVSRANHYLKEFTQRKAKSQVKLDRERLGSSLREDDPEKQNSPKRRKRPSWLK